MQMIMLLHDHDEENLPPAVVQSNSLQVPKMFDLRCDWQAAITMAA